MKTDDEVRDEVLDVFRRAESSPEQLKNVLGRLLRGTIQAGDPEEPEAAWANHLIRLYAGAIKAQEVATATKLAAKGVM